MNEPLENLYFNWLCAKVLRVPMVSKTRSNSFDILFKTLHNTEFVWLLPGDDNRAEDGKELRREFLLMADLPDQPDWRLHLPCSYFEMLIAFSRRAERNSNTQAEKWFWEMLQNLNLGDANDSSGIDPEEIQEVLEYMMFRNYTPDGDGGLFPLRQPTRDQTDLEIWYQFCDYLVDQNRLP